MKPLIVLAAALCLPQLCNATTWSSCQTITAVTNYIPWSNQVSLVLSPGVAPATCASDAPGVVNFRVGEKNVTADSLKSILATALSAHIAGKRIMVFYDPSTSACFASVLSIGGFAAQCP